MNGIDEHDEGGEGGEGCSDGDRHTPPPLEESPTKLIVNYIPEIMTQSMMQSLFSAMGKLQSCRLIANRGYGFVEYTTAEDAKKAKQAFDGLLMENKTLKVSHALLRPECKPPQKPEADWNLYVCNLPDKLSLAELHTLFSAHGRIINSRVAAGIAFVLFGDRSEAEHAIMNLNGVTPNGFPYPLTVKFALKSEPGKKRAPARPPPHAHWPLYIYNLAPDVEELTLWQLFGPFGAIISVRVIRDYSSGRSKGFGFVTMRSYDQASLAIQELNGYVLSGQALSVSFKTPKR